MPDKEIVLSPRLASDFDGELDDLADAVRSAVPGFRVKIQNPLAAPPGSFGPDLAEVLTVILPAASDYVIGTAIDAIVRKVKDAWWKRAHDSEESRVVNIYGPNGEILKKVVLPADADQAQAEDSE
jgi:hypothetical protein